MKNKIIGERIAVARMAACYSQFKLAVEVGASTSTIGCYEAHKRMPSIEQIERLADALRVSPAWLCGWSDEGDPRWQGLR